MSKNDLSSAFFETYGVRPEAISSAPGRVNIIGEFTDYNDGFVLPCALEFRTRVAYKKRKDNTVVVHSLQYSGERDSFSTDGNIEQGQNQWGNYVRAVVFALKSRGSSVGGADLMIDSNVPQGAGLSSSAALEVAVGGAFNTAYDLGYTNTDLALIGQYAENEFMDCQCGIMDQLVSANGREDNALFIDCRDLSTQLVAMPSELTLLIINSNYPRKLVDSEYNQRREDCQSAALAMQVPTLREATIEMLENAKNSLSNNQYRRAKHVITENQRVLDAMTALNNGSVDSLSRIMAASHTSLKEDFEVTVPATDWIVEQCSAIIGNQGAVRQTGGGFGGAVVCFCKADKVNDIQSVMDKEYPLAMSLKVDIFQCVAGDGLKIAFQ